MAAELDRPVRQLEILDRAPDVAQRQPEQPARGVVRHHQRPVGVQHRLGRIAEVECSLTEGLGEGLRGAARGVPYDHVVALAAGSVQHLAEQPALQIDRREQVGVGDQHLGPAEQQDPLVVEREVESAEDLGLSLGREVHERVSAHEQVDPRDRRVLYEVVAAEDHAAAQVLAEHVPLIGALEEPLERLARHLLELPREVRAVPRDVERLLVDVGGVDLHALLGTPRSPSTRARTIASV